jgi:hypothetical protein
MSIAVSVTVKASRFLRAMVACMSGLVVVAAGSIVTGSVGDLAVWIRFPIGLLSTFLALLGFYHTLRHQKDLHIDISGIGQIRIRREEVLSGSCQERNWPHVPKDGQPVRLLHDSTLWTNLLLLRLQTNDGKMIVVPVLPDSVSRDGFRALSVACRWIDAQHDSINDKYF